MNFVTMIVINVNLHITHINACTKSLLYWTAHLGVFNLQLGHLYEVLPEGHNTPALETGEFCEDKSVQLKKGCTVRTILHTRKQVQNASRVHGRTNLSCQTLRACQISASTASGAPLLGECPCSSVELYPKTCWSSRSQPTPELACTEGPDMFQTV